MLRSLVELGRELAAHAGCGHQRLPDRLHVVDQHRVVDVVGVSVQLPRDLVAQPALGGRRHLAAVAEPRQQLRARRGGHEALGGDQHRDAEPLQPWQRAPGRRSGR